MSQEVTTEAAVLSELRTKEYSVLIEGVIELNNDTDKEMFFDGLLDAIIEYVETHRALAALSMSYKEYDDTNADL